MDAQEDENFLCRDWLDTKTTINDSLDTKAGNRPN